MKPNLSHSKSEGSCIKVKVSLRVKTSLYSKIYDKSLNELNSKFLFYLMEGLVIFFLLPSLIPSLVKNANVKPLFSKLPNLLIFVLRAQLKTVVKFSSIPKSPIYSLLLDFELCNFKSHLKVLP